MSKLLKYRSCINWKQSRNITKQTPNRKNDGETNFTKSHCYRNLFPWKTQNEFNKHVGESIVYDIDGVIAINKPYGTAIQSYDSQNSNNSSTSSLLHSDVGECKYTIDSSLPYLRKQLNENDLCIVKSAERYTSGLVLLATSDKIKQQIRSEFAFAKSTKEPCFVNLCISTGCLTTPTIAESVGVTKREVRGKQTEPVILPSYSQRSLKSGRVKSAHVVVNTVKFNQETKTCLLTIASTQLKWHFVRVYAAFKGVGILGDNLFASRVRTILGKPISISPDNNAAYQPPTLDEIIQRKLLISQEEITNIPAHLHLYRLILKKKDVIIEAQPPEYFTWSCKQLNLIE